MYMEFVRYFIYLIWKKNIQIIFQLLIKSIGIKFMYQEIDQDTTLKLKFQAELNVRNILKNLVKKVLNRKFVNSDLLLKERLIIWVYQFGIIVCPVLRNDNFFFFWQFLYSFFQTNKSEILFLILQFYMLSLVLIFYVLCLNLFGQFVGYTILFIYLFFWDTNCIPNLIYIEYSCQTQTNLLFKSSNQHNIRIIIILYQGVRVDPNPEFLQLLLYFLDKLKSSQATNINSKQNPNVIFQNMFLIEIVLIV
eukprot:TRINITY_DN14707_c0_g1_i10.p1 TRINITY_DN14707_c0_g1~~TRINITY_DN14707_c0_g1_i10.p1  ORF type:complete len:250 (+),score=-13.28 TRINITY_DN14707_c0_g1_i10:1-750(+)